MSSEDYGRDLTGVQNLRKKHKRLEAELGAHEPAIQVSPSLTRVLLSSAQRTQDRGSQSGPVLPAHLC